MNKIFTKKITIDPIPPFNSELTLNLFAHGDKQIRFYGNGQFHQVLRIYDNLVLVNLTSEGSINEPTIKVTLRSNGALSTKDVSKAQETIRYIFNLDLNLSSFYEDVKTDLVMNKITQLLRGLKSPTTQTVFEAFVDSIVEQQISIKVANLIEAKLTKKFGDALSLAGEVYYAYPVPQTLASASVEEIRSCGLSQKKAEYIKGASTLISEKSLDLEGLKSKTSEQVITELDEIRGIGIWTAELTMLRGMKMFDAFPADDFGIRRVISTYYRNGEAITSAEARKIAQGWGSWKGLAAYYLIVAEIMGLKL